MNWLLQNSADMRRVIQDESTGDRRRFKLGKAGRIQ